MPAQFGTKMRVLPPLFLINTVYHQKTPQSLVTFLEQTYTHTHPKDQHVPKLWCCVYGFQPCDIQL